MGDMCGHSLWNVCVIHCKKLSLFLQNVETNRERFAMAKQSDFMDQLSKNVLKIQEGVGRSMYAGKILHQPSCF